MDKRIIKLVGVVAVLVIVSFASFSCDMIERLNVGMPTNNNHAHVSIVIHQIPGAGWVVLGLQLQNYLNILTNKMKNIITSKI